MQDAFWLKKNSVEKHWVEQQVDRNKVIEKQQRFKYYNSKIRNGQNYKNRVKDINDQLKVLQYQINIAKSQNEIDRSREMYEKLQVQLSYWLNRERQMRRLGEEKGSVKDNLTEIKRIGQLERQIQFISQEKEKGRFVKDVSRGK